MVGRLSRIRVSSVMRTFPPRISVGTLKSTRTRTCLPRTSRSRTDSFISNRGMEARSNGVISGTPRSAARSPSLFYIDMADVSQAMPHHIHRRLRLFERDIADKRFVLAVRRVHVHKQDLARYLPKTRNLQEH